MSSAFFFLFEKNFFWFSARKNFPDVSLLSNAIYSCIIFYICRRLFRLIDRNAMKKKLFLILILVLVAVFAVACTTDLHFADATVVRVAVDGISKVEYNAGEEIDIQGATVIATYSDGEIKVYELTKEMLSGYDMNVAEENKVVTVTYGGQSTTFTVNVNELSFTQCHVELQQLWRCLWLYAPEQYPLENFRIHL